MFPFNIIPAEREPSKEELFEGLLHHLSTALLLHGAGKHFCKYISDLKLENLRKEDVYEVMNHCCNQMDKIKGLLSSVPTISIKTDD